jgi:Arc/MetJ-type ribon-helix-helix transcriptional regulator
MRVITVNLPVTYLKAINGLVGEKGLYPSRSELVRVALRDFLIKELDAAQSFTNLTSPAPPIVSHPMQMIEEDMFVRVPVTTNGELDGTEYKTYRLVKK